MIRKLRIRLILITMTAVLLVLIILMGGINIFNYQKVVSESDDILQFLMESGGTFSIFGQPDMLPRDDFDPDMSMPEVPSMMPSEDESFPSMPSPRDSGSPFGRGRMSSPELAYETRYFSVLLSKDAEVLRTDIDRISAVSESTANEYAVSAFGTKKTSGFIGDYRFLLGKPDEMGNRLIVFQDCGASLSNFRSFRNISIFVSVICLLLVGVLVFFASGHIVRPVAESYEKQKRFITDAGHEIKTPLAIISADTDVMEMELSEENEWLSDIKLQTKRLSDLTQDLILLSKMEENSTVLDMKDLDLSALTKAQTGSFQAISTASGKTITSNIEDNIHIQGDKKSIDSLLSIVLDNAVKYCPEGGSIDVRVSRSKRGALIEVTNDTKETISQEECKNMFERFFRTDASRNSTTGGHGIGLSIAKAIVEKHKGRIAAASNAEKKLTISITL